MSNRVNRITMTFLYQHTEISYIVNYLHYSECYQMNQCLHILVWKLESKLTLYDSKIIVYVPSQINTFTKSDTIELYQPLQKIKLKCI